MEIRRFSGRLIAVAGITALMAAFSSSANAVIFDFGKIAEGDGYDRGDGVIVTFAGRNTGEAGNIVSDNEGKWSVGGTNPDTSLFEGVVPQINDAGQGGTAFDDYLTIAGIGVKASGTNSNPNIPAARVDAFLDAKDGALYGGLGVCSSASCTSGVSGANTADDNVTGGGVGIETLILEFDQVVNIDPGGFLFRALDHTLLTGTLLLNGINVNIAGGALLAANNLAVWAAVAASLHETVMATFKYNGSQFYLSVMDVSKVPVPAALPLFLSGLAGLGLLARRRKRAATA